MKYDETNYWGNKKALRKYLEGIQAGAKKAVEAEFNLQLYAEEEKVLANVGFDELQQRFGSELVVIFRELDKVFQNVLENSDTAISYSARSSLTLLCNHTENVESFFKELKSFINFEDINEERETKYYSILEQRQKAMRDLKEAWRGIYNGILGQTKKIKYICKDLEEAGFDLTNYYTLVAEEKAKENKPMVYVDYASLKIPVED